MKPKMLVIGLVPDRIDLLLCQGDRVVGSRRIPAALAHEPDTWCRSVLDAARSIATAAQEMGAAGLPTQVFYQSPTECADYACLALKSSGEAQQAAMLTSAEKLNCPIDGAVFRTQLVGRDRSARPANAHIIVAADHNESIAAIATMVETAGLSFAAATPLDAATMSRLISSGLAAPAGRRAYLHVGEQRSFFVIADSGNVIFARPISIGIASLSTALTRPIRGAGKAASVELGRETARTMLHKYGFPERTQVVHDELQITGAQVIPLLQPVLQRYIVELRQSLRFALPENQRHDIEVLLMGPGAALPRFAAILGEELSLTVGVDSAYAEFDCNRPDSRGSELTEAIREPKRCAILGLAPMHIEKARQIARMKRFLWAGAAAAIALIATDALRNHARLSRVRQQAEIIATRTNDAKTMQVAGERLISAFTAMSRLEGAISRETGARVSPRAILQEISLVVPQSIRLTEISLRRGDDVTTGTISGFVFQPDNASGSRELAPFIERLSASPLFEDVVLAGVQAGQLHDKSGQRFESVFTGVAAPGAPLPPPTASAHAPGASAP